MAFTLDLTAVVARTGPVVGQRMAAVTTTIINATYSRQQQHLFYDALCALMHDVVMSMYAPDCMLNDSLHEKALCFINGINSIYQKVSVCTITAKPSTEKVHASEEVVVGMMYDEAAMLGRFVSEWEQHTEVYHTTRTTFTSGVQKCLETYYHVSRTRHRDANMVTSDWHLAVPDMLARFHKLFLRMVLLGDSMMVGALVEATQDASAPKAERASVMRFWPGQATTAHPDPSVRKVIYSVPSERPPLGDWPANRSSFLTARAPKGTFGSGSGFGGSGGGFGGGSGSAPFGGGGGTFGGGLGHANAFGNQAFTFGNEQASRQTPAGMNKMDDI